MPLACATGGVVDCEQVTNSAESMIGPVPVAVLGLVWFGILLALVLAGRRSTGQLLSLQVGWSFAGLLVVFYLVYVELFLIGAICLWCTAIHAVVILVFLSSLWEATASPAD